MVVTEYLSICRHLAACLVLRECTRLPRYSVSGGGGPGSRGRCASDHKTRLGKPGLRMILPRLCSGDGEVWGEGETGLEIS